MRKFRGEKMKYCVIEKYSNTFESYHKKLARAVMAAKKYEKQFEKSNPSSSFSCPYVCYVVQEKINGKWHNVNNDEGL